MQDYRARLRRNRASAALHSHHEQKGDTSIELTMGTFLASVDNKFNFNLTGFIMHHTVAARHWS